MKKPPMDNIIQLKDYWYERLKRSGFKDIENKKGLLRVWSQELSVDKVTPLWRLSAEEYYRLASQLIHEERFILGVGAVDKIVWKMHARGIGSPKIATRMGMNPKTVESKIRLLQKKFIKT